MNPAFCEKMEVTHVPLGLEPPHAYHRFGTLL